MFDSALRHKPEERRKFVSQACGDDKTLLAEVESLLSIARQFYGNARHVG